MQGTLAGARISGLPSISQFIATAWTQCHWLLASGLLVCFLVAPAEGRSPDPDPVSFDPVAIFVTWRTDPLRTAVIDWHTWNTDRTPALEYRIRNSQEPWQPVWHETIRYPFASQPHYVHRVSLDGLTPGSEIEFRWGPSSAVYYFRTMPTTLERPLRVVIGGDVGQQKNMMDQTNAAVMLANPDFIIWAGDLAYADGRESRLNSWVAWFESIKETLIDRDGRVVPIVVAIGNHEVQGHFFSQRADYAQIDQVRAAMAPYFYTFFAFPGQPGYGVLDFGEYLSLLVLDTSHTNPVAGAQTQWLRQRLRERRHVGHVFPVYHVPAYPSFRSFKDAIAEEIRENWVPIFEEYGVRLAFEAHDHAYKRTFPLLRGRVDPRGITFVGDGAWGVETRRPDAPGSRWYLAQTSGKRHFVLATLEPERIDLSSVDDTGLELDRFQIPAQEGLESVAIAQVFTEAYPVGENVWEAAWFGRFDARRFPWIFHEQHKWLFAYGRFAGGVWLFDPNRQLHWLWTEHNHYPFLFHAADEVWLYFERSSGMEGHPRWFLRYEQPASWMQVP